jgi:hypothetical protein
MNKSQLQKNLESKKINSSAYRLDGGMGSGDCYVLSQESGKKWSVFYSERGQKNNQRFFSSENEACDFLFRILVGDSSTHLK